MTKQSGKVDPPHNNGEMPDSQARSPSLMDEYAACWNRAIDDGTDDPNALFTECPTVVDVFHVLGAEHEYLPYDPDAVCRAVLDEVDPKISDVTAEEMATLAEAVTGISFPSDVVTNAESELRNEYTKSDIVVLLYLMKEHAALIAAGEVSPTGLHPDPGVASRPSETPASTSEKEGFKVFSSLRVRTKRAITHLGKRFKNFTGTSQSPTADDTVTQQE